MDYYLDENYMSIRIKGSILVRLWSVFNEFGTFFQGVDRNNHFEEVVLEVIDNNQYDGERLSGFCSKVQNLSKAGKLRKIDYILLVYNVILTMELQ